MKKLLIILVSVIIFSLLVACNNKGEQAGKNVELETIWMEIKEHIAKDLEDNGIENALENGVLQLYVEANLTGTADENPTKQMILEHTQINEESINAGYYLAAMMNVNSDQIILLQAKDRDHVEDLQASLERELEAQTQTWEQYLPDQYEKVKNNVIQVNGNYLLYVTYEKPDSIVEIFNKHTK
ncbi:hypothetical protein BC6307_05525 [Sutcliffiella cohnii]|uniref:DUF4358 domain-containing protein n=1 Tax=Sutcliffiella cohnii TaxID=33932 RepID=A0A223KMQ6_9BACI|nr:DUF4358 domain-containing protein [Sutcliffiella cohnii]AST90781.1 hypothetical protein BC6307_05525 [Sutcliffiella cohnii]